MSKKENTHFRLNSAKDLELRKNCRLAWLPASTNRIPSVPYQCQGCRRDIFNLPLHAHQPTIRSFESLPMGLLMASTSVIRLAARPPISSCLRPAFRSIRRAPLPAPAVQSGWAKSTFSTTSVWKNQPGHEEETFEEFSARYMSFHQLDILRPLPLG